MKTAGCCSPRAGPTAPRDAMSLATRCAACGTVFRVVQDQLKVSDGWVRCGRCAEVFNAIEGLVELDTASQATPDVMAVAAALENPAADPLPREPLPQFAESTAALPPLEELRADPPAQTPGFVRDAERVARWRSPRRRALLGGAVLLGMALLAAQAALHWRDRIAAGSPGMRPALESMCRMAGCRVEPLRRIDGLAVESSALTRVEGSTLMRLAVVLRNREPVALMLPAFDLVLNDAQGRVVARRVLRASELGAAAQSLPAGAELPLAATLGTGDRSVAGYTIEPFYP